jgi:hypothetical protein
MGFLKNYGSIGVTEFFALDWIKVEKLPFQPSKILLGDP